MLYTGASEDYPQLGFPNYEIGLAYSSDGRFFTRLPEVESPYGQAGYVLDVDDGLPNVQGIVAGVVTDPDVVVIDGVLHMWYSSFACTGACDFVDPFVFGISHATSVDGIHWTPDTENPVPALLGSNGTGGQQPSVVYNPRSCQYEMWFTMDSDEEKEDVPCTFFPAVGFWHATSPDAVAWTINTVKRDVTWDGSRATEQYGIMTGVEATVAEGELRLYYSAFGTEQIPAGFVLPVQDAVSGDVEYVPAVIELSVASRDL